MTSSPNTPLEAGRVPDGTRLSSTTEPQEGLRPMGFDPSREEPHVIDLDWEFWKSLEKAAAESDWIPPEYFVNDWVSDCADFLRHGPPSPEREGGWQDIATAPKGRLIDIWIKRSDGGGVRWCDCYYDSICGEWRTTGPSGHLVCIGERFVTHWRPVPAPPEPGK